MHIKLRGKPGGELRVLDEAGNPVEGVLSVELHADGKNPRPVARIVLLAPVVEIDAEAEVERVDGAKLAAEGRASKEGPDRAP